MYTANSIKRKKKNSRNSRRAREKLKISKGPREKAIWTKYEDDLLKKKFASLGNNWSEIAKSFNGLTAEFIKSKWKSKHQKFSEDDNEFISLESFIPNEDEPTAIKAVPQEINFIPATINYDICSNPQIGAAPFLPNPLLNFLKLFREEKNKGLSGKVFKASKTRYSKSLPNVNVEVNIPGSFSNSSGKCYDVIDIISEGSSCVTAIIQKTESQEPFYEAAKIIPKEYVNKTHREDSIQSEVAFLKILSEYSEQYNIVQYHDDFEYSDEFGNGYIVIVTEMCSGDLANEDIEEIDIKETMLEIAVAIQFLHHNGIAHLDIKSENVLVNIINGNSRIKLCDFGFSTIGVSKINSIAGTSLYQGPEFKNPGEIDPFKADIYSLGILFYYLTEERQFPFYEGVSLSFQKCRNLDNFDQENRFQDLIKICMNPDPTKRPTIDSVIEFLNKIINN